MSKETAIPLQPYFRFMSKPLCFETDEDRNESQQRMISRDNQLVRLRDRILHSDGGTFLVAGYRGVGKTSFVNAVLDAVQQAEGPSTKVIGVRLTVAREVDDDRWLMHQLIRRLYLQVGAQLRPHLSRDVLEHLKLAYHRTVFDMAFNVSHEEKETHGREEKVKVSVGIPDLVQLGGGIGVSKQTEKSYEEGRQLALLDYDDREAENDIIELSGSLTELAIRQESIGRLRGLWRKIRRVPVIAPKKLKVKIVFVFDEMDKIEDTKSVERILRSLKNVLTATRFYFILVADGAFPEKCDQSLYRSVFADAIYLPCMWDAVSRFCPKIVIEKNISKKDRDVYDGFKRYLAFRGRGVIRDLVREFEVLVQWREGRPFLVLDDFARSGIDVYSRPQKLMDEESSTLLRDVPRRMEQLRDPDELRLQLYKALDVIIKDLHDGFDNSTLVEELRKQSVELVPHMMDNLLTKLSERRLLISDQSRYTLDSDWYSAINRRLGLERDEAEARAQLLRKLATLIVGAREARQAFEMLADPTVQEGIETYAKMVEAYDLVVGDSGFGLLSESDRRDLHVEFARLLNPQQEQDSGKKEAQFQEALRLDPESPEILYEYMLFLLWVDRTEDSERLFQRLASLHLTAAQIDGAFQQTQRLWKDKHRDSAMSLLQFLADLGDRDGQPNAANYDLLYHALLWTANPNEEARTAVIAKSDILDPSQRDLVRRMLDYSVMSPNERHEVDASLPHIDMDEKSKFLFEILRSPR